jgi:hypothetical protein
VEEWGAGAVGPDNPPALGTSRPSWTRGPVLPSCPMKVSCRTKTPAPLLRSKRPPAGRRKRSSATSNSRKLGGRHSSLASHTLTPALRSKDSWTSAPSRVGSAWRMTTHHGSWQRRKPGDRVMGRALVLWPGKQGQRGLFNQTRYAVPVFRRNHPVRTRHIVLAAAMATTGATAATASAAVSTSVAAP